MAAESRNRFDFLLNAKQENCIKMVMDYFEEVNFKIEFMDEIVELSNSSSPKFILKYVEEELIVRKNTVNEEEKKLTREFKCYPARLASRF